MKHVWHKRTCEVLLAGLVAGGIGTLLNRAAAAEKDAPAARSPVPAYRVEAEGFGASEADIRAVLDSAGGELYRFFPDYALEPLVVVHGSGSPITLFQRNEHREIVIRLDTGSTFWCQYAYQYAHELAHVLSGFKQGYEGNKWLEETLSETASLFVMRAMARSWKDAPPYPNWRDYRDALREYTDDIIRRRTTIRGIHAQGLAGFYREHQATLERNPTDRELNGAMAIVFLQLFEEEPARWEAIRWLNVQPAPAGERFADYLVRWRAAAPERHRPFITEVARLYGIALPAATPQAGGGAAGAGGL